MNVMVDFIISPSRGNCNNFIFRVVAVFCSQDFGFISDQRFRIVRTQDNPEKRKDEK